MKLRRIDSELVRRKLVRSRSHAQELIAQRRVLLDGEVFEKPARQMEPAQALVITQGDDPDYVSRGAFKLAGALDALGERGPLVQGRRCMDAGASTGGFTDVLLRRGAQSVVAVDVGYGQLAWRLQSDSRVEVMDRTNVRLLQAGDILPPPQLVVGDLSFISLTLVLPALVNVADESADFLLMVKPQFEIGKDRLGSGGVVRNLDHHHETIAKVIDCACSLGLGIVAVEASPLPGPSGNVEYFVYMRANHPEALEASQIPGAIDRAVREGPAGRGQMKANGSRAQEESAS